MPQAATLCLSGLIPGRTVFTWGCEEQGQLGRRITNRLHKAPWLTPGQCALSHDIIDIGAGLYHSFAIRKNGKVYAWGSNNFGQTGIFKGAGQSDAGVLYPTEVQTLGKQWSITTVFGGKDHSLALTDQGQCLTLGRIDNKALGILSKKIPSSDIIYDTYGKPLILKAATPIAGIDDEIVFATAGMDHSIAITKDGKAYSWGFNAQHQTGLSLGDEIEEPTLLQNKHVSGKHLASFSRC
ncbi:regulator of chromosome condensation 1/beta-lactamase-inhibitor protein II [Talaromyces proteolyticus]|uniref:Regulator of chromosome condensation 1/beta-lactamase-inhibitor protein II n=1 Tax=Talaromyces proteolyticus TaxID=1131652 RepID=A0AAD4KZ70_9EURO|nr:regulator of chromosome condensation 1/beta-lactamase-inhibitor protein II [Talaromyces proteolyticus]KAH8703319.1 regulator of chromosome condensation 1/beta-lactamase-inhibitor protein II [Talaromyces proteolyticus]